MCVCLCRTRPTFLFSNRSLEPDIARYAKRIIEFRDGKVKKDVPVTDRLIAAEVLPTLPEVGADDDEPPVTASGPTASV